MFNTGLASFFSGTPWVNNTSNGQVVLDLATNSNLTGSVVDSTNSGIVNGTWQNLNISYLQETLPASTCNLYFIAEALFKCEPSSVDSTPLSWGNGTLVGTSRSISITSSGELCFQFTAGAFDENNCVLTGKTGLNDGLYHHVVIVCPSNDKMLFFVDGKLVYSTSQSFSVLLTSFTTNNLRVGLNQTTNPVSVSRNLNVVYTRLYNIDRTNISDVLYNFYDISPVNVRYSYINQNNIWYKIEW